MPMLVVSGPEKAGKSTLIQEVIKQWVGETVVRRWHHRDRDPKDLRDTRNLRALKADVNWAAVPTNLLIWDRSWICESVYSTLLERPSELADQPFLGEWLYGRAVQTLGTSIVLLPEKISSMPDRDSDDHVINRTVEVMAYQHYARDHNLAVYRNTYDPRWMELAAEDILSHLPTRIPRPIPPGYCGPRDTKVIILLESTEVSAAQGEWLPGSTKIGFEFAKLLGVKQSLQLGWATAQQCPPNLLRSSEVLVAFGQDAATWASYHVGHKNILVSTKGLKTSPGRLAGLGIVQTAIEQIIKGANQE